MGKTSALFLALALVGSAPAQDLLDGPWSVAEATFPGLLLPARDPGARLSAALGCASSGDLEGALAYLDALLVAGAEGGERFAAERARLAVLVATRDALLADLAGSNRRLRVTVGEKEVPAKVESVADGRLHLASNAAGLEEVPIAELTPAVLRASLGRKVEDYGPEWVGPYLDLLAGHDDWADGLKRADGEEAQALAAAAEELSARMPDGRTRARLARLARPLPERAEALEAVVADLRTLLQEDGGHGLVVEARASLRSVAEAAWTAVDAARGGALPLAGEVTELERGRIRVRYDFDDPAELLDFERDDDYLPERIPTDFELSEEARAGEFGIGGGFLRGRGAACFRHLLDLEEPKVRYRFRYSELDDDGSWTSFVMVGVADDGKGNRVEALNHLDLLVRDTSRGFQKQAAAEDRILTEEIDAELAYLSKSYTLKSNDVNRGTVPCGPRRSGATFLWLYTEDPVSFLHLEIEGRPTPEGAAALRAGWVAARVAELGLGD